MNNNAQVARVNAEFYDEFWSTEPEKVKADEIARAGSIQIALSDRRVTQANILDLGCGRGWLAQFLNNYGTVTGVDFSAKFIDFANQYYGSMGKFFVADPELPLLGLPRNSFDVVVASEVLEHVVDHREFTRQTYEYLKPKGICIFTTPNGAFFKNVKKKYGTQFQPIENWLTPRELNRLLVQSGFKVIRHEGVHFRNINYGFKGYFVSNTLRSIFARFGALDLYHRAILHCSLYQMITAQKDG